MIEDVMKAELIFLYAFSLLTLLPSANAADVAAAPVILIDSTIGYPPPRLSGETNIDVSPKLVTGLWSNGRIVWSESRIGGGPPYQQGRFDRERLASLLGSLEAQGAFTNAALQRPRFGPDASTTRIVINDGRRKLRMESWHESFETNTNLIVTAQGVSALKGRSRDAVLQNQPEDYRYFRQIWSEIRDGVASLIPDEGEPCKDEVSIPIEWR